MKRGLRLFLVGVFILLIASTFVSAFSFTEFWNKITGNVISYSCDSSQGEDYCVDNSQIPYSFISTSSKPSIYTLSFFIKPNSYSTAAVASSSSTGANANVWGMVFRDTGAVEIWTSDGTNGQQGIVANDWNSAGFPSNEWTHVVAVVGWGNITYYKNGVWKNSIPQTVQNSGTSYKFSMNHLGEYNGFYLDGKIRNVELFGKVMSGSEVSALYNSRKTNSGDSLIQFTCDNNELAFERFICSNGCENSACIVDDEPIEEPEDPIVPTPVNNITCSDSDNGKNYYVKGTVTHVQVGGNSTTYVDACRGINNLTEYSCDYNKSVQQDLYYCANGCEDGKCILETISNETISNETIISSCSDVISFLKSPTDLTLSNGEKWENFYNDIFYNTFYNSWANTQDYNRYSFVWTSVNELSDQTAVEQKLNYAVENLLCEKRSIYFEDSEKSQTVYLCKNFWRIANEAQEVSNNFNYDQDLVVIWFSDNKLFNFEFSINDYSSCNDYECDNIENWNHMREQDDLIDFMDSLLNNEEREYIKMYLDSSSESFVKYFLNKCSSSISESGEYSNSWGCKQEPVICPPHGEQKQICTRWNSELGKQESKELIMQCNPGICSGCMVPRWFESDFDNRCIEYGFRFKQQTAWDLKEVFIDDDIESRSFSVEDARKYYDIELEVYENNTAFFSYDFYSVEELKTIYYTLEKGKTYDWGFDSDSDGLKYTLIVDDIYYDTENYNKSFITLTVRATGYQQQQIPQYLNMYCDIDGGIKEQKIKAGEECQNNYECFSNLCSYGECLGLKEMIQDIKGFKAFFTKIFCKVSHLTNEEAYLQCVVDGVD